MHKYANPTREAVNESSSGMLHMPWLIKKIQITFMSLILVLLPNMQKLYVNIIEINQTHPGLLQNDTFALFYTCESAIT